MAEIAGAHSNQKHHLWQSVLGTRQMISKTSIEKSDVVERLSFAERRLEELVNLNGGDLPGADPSERQQIVQEFFFHLVGATELLAQFVNQERSLGIHTEDVTVKNVSDKLSISDPIKPLCTSLHKKTRKEHLLSNPYTDDAYVFRIRNYRNQVTHRHRNPFRFTVPSRDTYLFLDPRDRTCGVSNQPAQDEMYHMLHLIRNRCETIIHML